MLQFLRRGDEHVLPGNQAGLGGSARAGAEMQEAQVGDVAGVADQVYLGEDAGGVGVGGDGDKLYAKAPGEGSGKDGFRPGMIVVEPFLRGGVGGVL